MTYKSIFQAIKANNFLAVKEFTEIRNINKNAINKAGYNIIEIAFYNTGQDETIINYLIDTNYPINFSSTKLQGIIFNIIKRDSSALLEKLIKKNLPLHYKSIQGYSLYEYAFFYKSSKCINLLSQYFSIEEDPFIMIEKGQYLSVINFLKNNKDYDIYFKKGYKNLLLQSLISRNLKCFIYLLRQHCKDDKKFNSFISKEIRNFAICAQFKNESFLKSFIKQTHSFLESHIKIRLLHISILNQHLDNIDYIYNNLNDEDKLYNGGELYSRFYDFYKTDNESIIKLLYDKNLNDKKDIKLKKMAEKAEHPTIFYLRKQNKKKYDFYLTLYPNYSKKEEDIFIELSFANCNIELVNHFLKDKEDKRCLNSKLLNAFLLSKKSPIIKFKFYKQLKEQSLLPSLFLSSYSEEYTLNFYSAVLYTRQYKLFNMIIKENKKLNINDFSIVYSSYRTEEKLHLPHVNILIFFLDLNTGRSHDLFYDVYNSKNTKVNYKEEDYLESLITILNFYKSNINDFVNIDFMTFIHNFNNKHCPNYHFPKKKHYIDISKSKIIDVLEKYCLFESDRIGLRSKLEQNQINNSIIHSKSFNSENKISPQRKRL